MSASRVTQSIPRYRSPALAKRLPPPKLPLFRSVVQHPPAPFAVQEHARAIEASDKGADKGKQSSPAPTSQRARPLIGPTTLLYTSSPRPLIPLTASPVNHKLWNPPAPDSTQSRSVEKDESGRLSRFASRFGAVAEEADTLDTGAAKKEDGLFGVEGDLSWLEGVTAQSPGGALGKRDIVGPQKATKKGKK
ncbi:hypothetical protein JCM11641_003531 [Rhodosporidiobolus odoratus]